MRITRLSLLAPWAVTSFARAEAVSPRPPRATKQQQQQKEEQYEILTSETILERLMALAADYPAFVTLTTTQEWFGLSRAGNEEDCSFDKHYPVHGVGCNNYVLIIHDKEAHPEDPDVQLDGRGEEYLSLDDGWFNSSDGGKSGWRYVPDVFLSGSVHGNERVGPTSLMEMSELLVEAAHCESLPRMRYFREGDAQENDASSRWTRELASAETCREGLAGKGVPAPLRRWLARLVATRRSVVIPTANALGYFRDQREENGIDPNRDFPFDIKPQDSAKCMQTIAGRSINELFRSHLFPVGLTFHGGMEVIGYEWGAPTYVNKKAPGDTAQHAIAEGYSRYAGGFPGHSPYAYGTMNDKVYYVRGGMEDWAFAGSWDPERVVECTPTTFGGYPANKTRYNNATLRAFNMLIETSNIKNPHRKDLGKRTAPLVSSGGNENGHVARNLRLALLAIDVVEPYVSIQGVGGLELEDDVVPAMNLRRYNRKSYLDNGMVLWVPSDRGNVTTKISWTVGGAFNIDATELVVGPWNSLPTNLADGSDGTYPSAEMLMLINGGAEDFRTVVPSVSSGRSRWHAKGPSPTLPSDGHGANADITLNPTFEAEIDVIDYPPGTTLAVFARARVDKDWLSPAANVGPADAGPVSHVVNSRRNPAYRAANAGKVVRGRPDDWWYSVPVAVVVGSGLAEEAQVLREAEARGAPTYETSERGGVVRVVHVNSRSGYLYRAMEVVESRKNSKDKGAGSNRGNEGGEDDNNNGDSHTSSSRNAALTEKSMPMLLEALAIGVAVAVGVAAFAMGQRRMRNFERLSVVASEEDMFSERSYQDDPVDNDDAEFGFEITNPGRRGVSA